MRKLAAERQEQAAIVEQRSAELETVRDAWQKRDQRRIPEENLQQHGNVSKRLHVGGRRGADDPGRREAAERDDERQHGAKRAREHDHEQRVEHRHDDRSEV